MRTDTFSEEDILAAVDWPHESLRVVFEHGRQWVVCNACGWQASVNDSNRGIDLETVTDGDDESCRGTD